MILSNGKYFARRNPLPAIQCACKTQSLYGIHFALWSFLCLCFIIWNILLNGWEGEKSLFVPVQLSIWVKFRGLESDIWLQLWSGPCAWMVWFSLQTPWKVTFLVFLEFCANPKMNMFPLKERKEKSKFNWLNSHVYSLWVYSLSLIVLFGSVFKQFM